MSERYCEVIVDIAHSSIDHIYDYRVPEGLTDLPGHRVLVPFGRMDVEGIVLREKDAPDYDPEKIKTELIDAVCEAYEAGISLRAVAKSFGISAMKVRKILITGGAYTNDLVQQIGELYRGGKSVDEIAALLKMTRANVNSYLPYKRLAFNLEETTVNADRHRVFRKRVKAAEKLRRHFGFPDEMEKLWLAIQSRHARYRKRKVYGILRMNLIETTP